MRKKKMLISLALLFVMLMNCILPVFAEGEAVNNEKEIKFNAELYSAIVDSMNKDGLNFISNDIKLTIQITPELVEQVKRLNLNEHRISDLTGIENFTSLEHLELSGNNLNKDSNLEALNNLSSLNYLDLSTNKIEDISSIENLIEKIQKEKGTIILSGQNVVMVHKIIVDDSGEGDNKLTEFVELPPILEKVGYIKKNWLNVWNEAESFRGNFEDQAPVLKAMINRVTKDNNKIEVSIFNEEKQHTRKGMLAIEIYIHDDDTEAGSAANLNPASKNMLNGSRFYIYVVTCGKTAEGIYIPDTNLYNSIVKQLTAGQTINSKLDSYPYKIDVNGKAHEERFIISDNNKDKNTSEEVYLVNVDEFLTTGNSHSYVCNLDSNTIEKLNLMDDGTKDDSMDEEFELYGVDVRKDNFVIEGNDEYPVTETLYGYIAKRNNANCRNLFIKAYKEAHMIVINDLDLVNKITSLILNNKEIYNLEGLQYFVGLESNLNVSHNYLNNIRPIFELEPNKREYEAQLQGEFKKYLNTKESGNLNRAYEDFEQHYAGILVNSEDIVEKTNQIAELLEGASKIEETTKNGPNPKYEEELQTAIDKINEIVDEIIGYDERDSKGNTKHVTGINEKVELYQDEIRSDISRMYIYISFLSRIYNNNYKLTTLLTDKINYQNREEYITYKNEIDSSKESAKGILDEELDYLEKAFDEHALSKLDLELMAYKFGIGLNISVDGEKNPIAKFHKELFEDNVLSRMDIVNIIEGFREIGIMSEAANKCLISRMVDSNITECTCEEYLKEKIEAFKDESIPTEFEEELLNTIQATKDLKFDEIQVNSMIDKFISYTKQNIEFKNADEKVYVPYCNGAYRNVFGVEVEKGTVDEEYLAGKAKTTVDDKEFKTVYAGIKDTSVLLQYAKIKDMIYIDKVYIGEQELLDQLVTLVNKYILNSDKINRYITLANLKRLDISYNSYLNDIDRLSELKGLSELNANSDYIDDLSLIDWSELKYLKKLGLAYNFIESIKPLEDIKYLEDLDASNNLLHGDFDFELAKLEYLKNLNLSDNKISDVRYVLEYVDTKAGYDRGTYLARPDTLNLNLNNQKLSMDIRKEDIFLTENPEVININLPPIFTQLLAIDTERTAFGETSQNGRIESEGKYVTLNTRTLGEKEGKVTVVAMSGDGSPVDTCVGEGTTLTIRYKVNDLQVERVNITPHENVTVNPGSTQQFQAAVSGKNITNDKVIWTIENATSENTNISSNGLLTVGKDEKAESIDVIATSEIDKTKFDRVTVNVNKNGSESEDSKVTNIVITPNENVSVKPGNLKEFTAVVEGDNIADKTVSWSIQDATSKSTVIDENGKLIVGDDEEADMIFVTATSNEDNKFKVSVKVKIVKEIINQVKINPNSTVKVDAGSIVKFTASVEGENVKDTTVTWYVIGNESDNTVIDENGILTIGNDETAKTLVVKVVSNADPEKQAQVDVEVKNTNINNVVVSPAKDVKVEAGKDQIFTATVEGQNVKDSTVTWSVEGNTSRDTVIDENGKLTIGKDEKADKIIVTAVSNENKNVLTKVEVEITKTGSIINVIVEPNKDVTIKPGETQRFTVKVEGTNINKEEITFKLKGASSIETNITKDGLLTVGANEVAKEITLVVNVKVNDSVEETKEIVIKINKTNKPGENIELGYTADDEYLVDVKAKTPIKDFKANLVDTTKYNVVIKKDNKEITSGNIGTGMYVQIQDKDGNTIADKNGDLYVFEIVVKGDVNGDGYANSLDSILIKAYRNEVAGVNLYGSAKEAADINNDGKVNVIDSKLLLYHRAEVKGYNLDYENN